MIQGRLNIQSLQQLHRWVGIATVIVFLLTGQYMHWGYDHLKGMADSPRMMFRSAHIYLLWSGLLNTILGLYFQASDRLWARGLQLLGSLAILLGPPLLVAAFVSEPWLNALVRPYARPAIYIALGGTLFHLIAGVGNDFESGDRRSQNR